MDGEAMTTRFAYSSRWGFLACLLGIAPAAFAQGNSFVSRPEANTPPRFLTAPSATLTSDDVIARMLERNRSRSSQLQRYSEVRTYEIRNSEGKLAAQAVVRVNYEAPDRKDFSKTSEQGSLIVRHLVFDRLMQGEGETTSGREHHDSEITAENYAFGLAGEESLGPYRCFVLEVTPKRKDKYLFEGKIWVDTDDFAIVKMAGRPAKKPSFWINDAEFVRQFQKIDGFWLPYRDETSIEVKKYGRKTFTVDHERYIINSTTPVETKTSGTADPD
jgi:hypothetical protein